MHFGEKQNEKIWAEDLIKELGIDSGKLPELRKSFEIAGYLTVESK